MTNKSVCIFPYLNIEKVIKMGDFEIHPIKSFDLTNELEGDEVDNLNIFALSFRETFFKEGESPKQMTGIGILQYNGTILRDLSESGSIHDNIKILFLLLKLHVSHDFFNPQMNNINVKSFDLFGFNVCSNRTTKFGNNSECKELHSTVPENITGLGNVNFFPIQYCTNNIPVEFKMFGGGEQVFGASASMVDLTEIYNGILSNEDFYKKFLNIASVHFGLEQQNDLFFYYSIIPSIIEVLFQISGRSKKPEAIRYGKLLDSSIIKDNNFIEMLVHTKSDGTEIREELGIISRTFVLIYDLRNLLLHEGKKSFEKLKVEIHGVEVRIYDIFQLIFKYVILHDLIEKGILENSFTKVRIIGNPLTSILTGEDFEVQYFSNQALSLDQELEGLIRKTESDRDLAINI